MQIPVFQRTHSAPVVMPAMLRRPSALLRDDSRTLAAGCDIDFGASTPDIASTPSARGRACCGPGTSDPESDRAPMKEAGHG